MTSRRGDALTGTSRQWERDCAEAISLIGDGFYSGVYTPTLTNVANLDGTTAFQCQYTRMGDNVVVSGGLNVDATLAGVSTQVGISLPISSNFGSVLDCAGTAAAPGVAGQCAAIKADTTNDRAQLEFMSGSLANNAMFFIFMYRII